MTLFKLSYRNIKRSFKDYSVYFLTLILGIVIFYSFNSLESQSVMLNLGKANSKSIELITTVLSAVSVLVAVVFGFLIIYANRFIMKRRNKEFGIYMTLGMGKGKISRIIVGETILIGLLSLIIGLILGVAVAQIMSIVVANLFDANMEQFKFVISTGAIFKTILYFLIIYIFVMLFNIIQVSRCKLIDLIHSNKKSEEIKMKNAFISTVVFVMAISMLVYAYYNVTVGIENLQTAASIYVNILLGVVGTFLFFWSLSGILVKIIMSLKGVYFHNLNSFTLRQVSSKINTTVVAMSVICLMLFVTISIFSSAVSMNITLKSDMEQLAKADISILKEYTHENDPTIQNMLYDQGITVNDDLKDIGNFKLYESENVTLKETYGSYYDVLAQQFASQGMDVTDYFGEPETLVKLSDYNKLAKIYGQPTYELADNQFMIISNFKNTSEWYTNGLKEGTSFELNGKIYKAKYDKTKDGYLMMAISASNAGFIVLPDHALDDLLIKGELLVANYNKQSKSDMQELEDQVMELNKLLLSNNVPTYIGTKMEIYNANIGTSAMAIFVGLYIGIIFLISSAAILALKELSDAADSKEKYKILRRIGIDEKMIHRSLFTQTSIFFGFPLLLAVIHSMMGIKVSNAMLQTLGRDSMLQSIATTVVFLILIYGGYFVVTYVTSKNIIKDDLK